MQRGAALASQRGGLAHEPARFLVTDTRRQREDQALGHDLPARGPEVDAHALGVHLQPTEHLGHVRGRSSCCGEYAGDAFPLGVPGPDRAFVLLDDAAGQERGVGVRPARARQSQDGPDRVALVRERRRSAAALAVRLAQLTDLCLRHQHDVQRDLAERTGQDRERRSEGRDAHARGVPGNDRLRQAELARHPASDVRSIVAERGQRARRAAELHGQPVACVEHEPARLEHADEPRRGLDAEGRRQGLLEQRARHHRRRAMTLGERGARGCHLRDIDQHELEGAPADEHRRRVDDVLAGRPVVHVAGGLASHRRAQCTHERLGRVAGPAPLARRCARGRRDRPGTRRRSARRPRPGSGRPLPRPAPAPARCRAWPGARRDRRARRAGPAARRSRRTRLDALEPDVVLGQHRGGRARGDDVAQLRQLELPLERVAARASGAASTSSTTRSARRARRAAGRSPSRHRAAPGCPSRASSRAPPPGSRTSAIARLRPFAPVGGTMCAASPAR